jgi:hypothetical protein
MTCPTRPIRSGEPRPPPAGSGPPEPAGSASIGPGPSGADPLGPTRPVPSRGSNPFSDPGIDVAPDVENAVVGEHPGRRCGPGDRSRSAPLIERVCRVAGPVHRRPPRPGPVRPARSAASPTGRLRPDSRSDRRDRQPWRRESVGRSVAARVRAARVRRDRSRRSAGVSSQPGAGRDGPSRGDFRRDGRPDRRGRGRRRCALRRDRPDSPGRPGSRIRPRADCFVPRP